MAKESKEQTVVFGMTEELMELIKEQNQKNNNVEKKDFSEETKKFVLNIVKNEIERIQKELKKTDITADKYYDLISKLDKVADIIKYW